MRISSWHSAAQAASRPHRAHPVQFSDHKRAEQQTKQRRHPVWSIQPLPETPLDQVEFTVLDCEATGLQPHRNDLLEIAFRQYRQGQETHRFHTLVKPNRPLSDTIRSLTRLSDQDFKQAPSPREALTSLCEAIGKHPILVGDYIDFDIRMIRHKLRQFNLRQYLDRFDPRRSFCTRTLTGRLFPKYKRSPAKWMLHCLNLTSPEDASQHRQEHWADEDVRNVTTLFGYILHKLKREKGITTLKALQDFQEGIYRYYPPRRQASDNS